MSAGSYLNTMDDLRPIKHINEIYQRLKDVYIPYIQQLWYRGLL